MKKRILISIILSILFVTTVGVYFGIKYYKIDFENLIVEESDFLFYSEQNEKVATRVEAIIDLLNIEEEKKEKVKKSFNDLNKLIDRAMVLGLASYQIDYNPIERQKLVVVFDTGNKYPLVNIKMKKYFKSDGDFKVLKEKYREKLKENGIINGNNNIYLYNYRGYQILSFNKNALSEYENEVKKEKQNETFVKNLKNEHMYIIDFERLLGKELVLGENTFDYLLGYIEVGENKINLKNKLEFKNNNLSMYFSPDEDRVLSKYVHKKNTLYLNNQSLGNIVFLFFVYSVDMLNVQSLNWSALAERIGDEAYFDLEKKTGAVELNDPSFFNFIFNLVLEKGSNGEFIIGTNTKLYIRGNILFINEILEAGENNIVEKGDLIIANLDLNTLFNLLSINYKTKENCPISINMKNVDEKVFFNLEFDSCFYEKLIKGIESTK